MVARDVGAVARAQRRRVETQMQTGAAGDRPTVGEDDRARRTYNTAANLRKL